MDFSKSEQHWPLLSIKRVCVCVSVYVRMWVGRLNQEAGIIVISSESAFKIDSKCY